MIQLSCLPNRMHINMNRSLQPRAFSELGKTIPAKMRLMLYMGCVYPKTFFQEACRPQEMQSLRAGLQSTYRYKAWDQEQGWPNTKTFCWYGQKIAQGRNGMQNVDVIFLWARKATIPECFPLMISCNYSNTEREKAPT